MGVTTANMMQKQAGINTTIFLDVNGVFIATKNPGPTVIGANSALKEFIANGGTVYACPHCLDVNGIPQTNLIDGVKVVQNEVVEMVCPFCSKSLLSEDNCEICGATTTLFGVSEGFLKICNRRGCKMHLRFLLTGE